MGIILFIDPHFLAVCSIARTLNGGFIGGLQQPALPFTRCSADATHSRPPGVAEDADRHGVPTMARVPNARADFTLQIALMPMAANEMTGHVWTAAAAA